MSIPNAIKERRGPENLADGSIKVYRYARRPAGRAHAAGSMAAMVEADPRSPEWDELQPKTKTGYRHNLDRLGVFGAI